jgi:hypothetical protein
MVCPMGNELLWSLMVLNMREYSRIFIRSDNAHHLQIFMDPHLSRHISFSIAQGSLS